MARRYFDFVFGVDVPLTKIGQLDNVLDGLANRIQTLREDNTLRNLKNLPDTVEIGGVPKIVLRLRCDTLNEDDF